MVSLYSFEYYLPQMNLWASLKICLNSETHKFIYGKLNEIKIMNHFNGFFQSTGYDFLIINSILLRMSFFDDVFFDF